MRLWHFAVFGFVVAMIAAVLARIFDFGIGAQALTGVVIGAVIAIPAGIYFRRNPPSPDNKSC